MTFLFPPHWPEGLALVVLLSLASLLTGKISPAGALLGGLITFAMFLGASWMGILLIFLLFSLGTAASWWKRAWKKELGLAQAQGGRRGAVHAFCNAGIAGACGLAAWCFQSDTAALMMAGSMAAALSDTLSSELGNVYGHRFVDIVSLKPATRGSDGAISLEGSLFGLLGALLIALVVWGVYQQVGKSLMVLLAGILGNMADSLLGATWQRQGLLNNHSTNFWATAVAALSIFLWNF